LDVELNSLAKTLEMKDANAERAANGLRRRAGTTVVRRKIPSSKKEEALLWDMGRKEYPES
jgi:hypothetical protein